MASRRTSHVDSPTSKVSARARRARSGSRSVETLEGRQLLATFAVTSLANAGPGSLRAAIVAANRSPGADTIDFDVDGTIRVGQTPLPAVSGKVTLDGSTAPGFGGSPVVAVAFPGKSGLLFEKPALGSTIDAVSVTSGATAEGSRVEASAATPCVTYYDTSLVTTQPVSGWQGIRGFGNSGALMITGTAGDNGLLVIGSIAGVGTDYQVNYPGASLTSVYGPDDLGGGAVRLVGSYRNADASSSPVVVNGFLYQGTLAGLGSTAGYETVDYPGAQYNYVHSTMGGLAVGNYDGQAAPGLPLGPGHAYVYNVASGTFIASVTFPGSVSNTAYGIWYNGGTSYTIAGGYSPKGSEIGKAYLVDYDSSTGLFSHWKSYNYDNGAVGTNIITHFEGISSVQNGVYTLNADSVQSGSSHPAQGSFVTVTRNPDGSFGAATWVNLDVPKTAGISSSNSVYGNDVVGLVISPSGSSPFQATVNQAS